MNCVLHQTHELEYFCQTCVDPICEQCVRSNPHSDQSHKIQKIQTAVQNRKKRFQLYISNEINPLRQRIRQKLKILKDLQSSQLNYRNNILKDIVLQFQSIEERTKAKAQKKITSYQTQIKYYQEYLNSIDDLAYTFDKTSHDPYNFLILYKDLSNQLKSLELIHIEQKLKSLEPKHHINLEQKQIINDMLMIDQKLNQNNLQQKKENQPSQNIMNEFPREIKTIYQTVSTLPQIKFRNQFINGLIAHSSQNYKEQQKKQIQNQLQKNKNSLHLFNNTNQSIILLNSCKTCIFCQSPFNIQNLNDACQQNKSFKAQISKNYSHIKVQSDYKGTKRHYWVDSAVTNRRVPDLNSHVLVRVNTKKQFYNSLKDLSIIKCYLKNYEINNQQQFMQPFKEADKQNKRILSKIAFKYILTKFFSIRDTQCELLTQLLSIDWKIQKLKIKEEMSQQLHVIPQKIQFTDMVNYTLLQQFVKNPFFAYQQYQKIEQQIDKTKPIAPKTIETRRYKF